MVILRIFLSPEHNFFGHYGKPAGTSPVVEVDEVSCIAGQGLEGDRFCGYKAPDYKGQATFFSIENHEWLCEKLDVSDRDPSVYRRNLLTSGVDLPSLVGETFEIQGVVFQGTEEARPCEWMDQAFAPGAFKALKGRGGLRARILEGGLLKRTKNS